MTVFTDNANRANEDPLANSNWTTHGSAATGFRVLSNQFRVGASFPCCSVLTGATFASPPYVKHKNTLLNNDDCGVATCLSAVASGAVSGYVVCARSSTIIRLKRIDAGVLTQILSLTVSTYTAADEVGIAIDGDDVVAYLNDTEIGRATDTTYRSNIAGFFGNTSQILDDFVASDEFGGGSETDSPVESVAFAAGTPGQTSVTWSATYTDATPPIDYYVAAVADGAAAPSGPQMVAGTGGTIVAADSDLDLASGAGASGTITGLSPGTPYDLYRYVVDNLGNPTAVTKFADITTDPVTPTATPDDLTINPGQPTINIALTGFTEPPTAVTIASVAQAIQGTPTTANVTISAPPIGSFAGGQAHAQTPLEEDLTLTVTGPSQSANATVRFTIAQFNGPNTFFGGITGLPAGSVFLRKTFTIAGSPITPALGDKYLAYNPVNLASLSSDGIEVGSAPAWEYDLVIFDEDASPPQWTALQNVPVEEPDTTPDAFSFADQAGVPVSSTRQSNIITVAGVNTPTPISVTNGSYIKNGGAPTADPGTVVDGDTVQLTHPSSSSFGTTVTTTVSIGGVQATFSSTTLAAPDTTPNAFTFVDQTNVPLSTLIESNIITVLGIDAAAAISVANGEYSKNGGAYTAVPGTVVLNDTVRVRHPSSNLFNSTVATVLTIGGVSDTFSTTTIPPTIPVFSGTIPNLTVDKGASVNYNAGALFTGATSYALNNAPAWMSINPATGQVIGSTITPGLFTDITVVGSNASGQASSNAFSVRVERSVVRVKAPFKVRNDQGLVVDSTSLEYAIVDPAAITWVSGSTDSNAQFVAEAPGVAEGQVRLLLLRDPGGAGRIGVARLTVEKE